MLASGRAYAMFVGSHLGWQGRRVGNLRQAAADDSDAEEHTRLVDVLAVSAPNPDEAGSCAARGEAVQAVDHRFAVAAASAYMAGRVGECDLPCAPTIGPGRVGDVPMALAAGPDVGAARAGGRARRTLAARRGDERDKEHREEPKREDRGSREA